MLCFYNVLHCETVLVACLHLPICSDLFDGSVDAVILLRCNWHIGEQIVTAHRVGGFKNQDYCCCLLCHFYPRDAMLARVLAVIVCLCVCQTVTRRYCIKTAKRGITQTTPRDSAVNLVF